MVITRRHIPSRSTQLWLLLGAAALGIYFFLRVPQIPRVWWAVFSVLIALGFFASSLFSHTLANVFANGQSRLRYVLWRAFAVSVGIESGIGMARVIGPVGAVLFGVALAMVLIVIDPVNAPSASRHE
jgi:hypothetical protein